MKIPTRMLLCASLLALAAGCGSSAGSDNEAAAANTQGPAMNDMAGSMPSGPFAQAEMQMNERMMAATGANASDAWARKMIEHHRGAVAMSQILIDQGGDPQFVRMARETMEKQQREIGELERMVSAGISGGTGDAGIFRPVEQQMHQAMMAASGDSLSETWARKMIAHHQGAVDMSELVIRQGGNSQVLAMARRTAEDQRREIAHLEAMLRGERMPEHGAPAPAETGSRDTAAPAPRPRNAEPKAPAAPPSAQRNQARPAPAATPAETCAPEHRAAGHC